MKRALTCIVCPLGCTMSVEISDDGKISVSGNTCKRGESYAVTECKSPMRTVTTTVRTAEGEMVSVKTDRPIPKEKVFECMKIINSSKIHLPISIGDVIIENVFGARVVATQSKNQHGGRL